MKQTQMGMLAKDRCSRGCPCDPMVFVHQRGGGGGDGQTDVAAVFPLTADNDASGGYLGDCERHALQHASIWLE